MPPPWATLLIGFLLGFIAGGATVMCGCASVIYTTPT